jgi:5'-3' exoribonuclease 2
MVNFACSCRFYPFNYAPFASDLKFLYQFKISFTTGKPLRPFDQLMAALPPEMHSCALPKCYSKLIECEESTIQLFYPSGIYKIINTSSIFVILEFTSSDC